MTEDFTDYYFLTSHNIYMDLAWTWTYGLSVGDVEISCAISCVICSACSPVRQVGNLNTATTEQLNILWV